MSPQMMSSQVMRETHETLFVFCPTCARESLAEAPPCPDGHAECCPELACLECATALLDAPIVQFVRPARTTATATASTTGPRHAA